MIVPNFGTVDLEFAQRPSVRELFACWRERTNRELPTGFKFYFRMHDANYVGVTARTASISWDSYYCDGNVYYARVATTLPPSSPDRSKATPRHMDNSSVKELAVVLSLLSMESTCTFPAAATACAC